MSYFKVLLAVLLLLVGVPAFADYELEDSTGMINWAVDGTYLTTSLRSTVDLTTAGLVTAGTLKVTSALYDSNGICGDDEILKMDGGTVNCEADAGAGGGWTATATSDLDMAGYDITAIGSLVAGTLYGDGSNLSGVSGGFENTADGDLDMAGFDVTAIGSLVAGTLYGDGSNLSGVAAGWQGTATSDLDMTGYDITAISTLAAGTVYADDVYTTGTGVVTAGSNFGTDNLLIKSDGVGKAVQATGISIDDDDNVTGINNLTITGTLIVEGSGSYLEFDEVADAPDTPSAGKGRVYLLDDNDLYLKDDTGAATNLTSGGDGAQTPWESNINAAGFDLTAVGTLAVGTLFVDGTLYGDGSGLTGVSGGLEDISCRIYADGTTVLPDNSYAAIQFNQERFDEDTMHDTVTNNTRITIKTAGKYMVGGTAKCSTAVTLFTYIIGVRLNGATYIAKDLVYPRAETLSSAVLTISTFYDFEVNDYIELMFLQNSNGASSTEVDGNVSPEFWAVRLTE